MENQQQYQKAKDRVEAKIGFYTHLAVFILVNALLIYLNYTTSPGYLWFKWPLFGWGIGLLFHALGYFLFSDGSSFKERMIEKELKKRES